MKSDQTVYRCDRCDHIVRVDLNAAPDGFWWDLSIAKLGRSAPPMALLCKLLCQRCSTEFDHWLRAPPDADG